jgi:quercetin dioxygenase-like cupin family protein
VAHPILTPAFVRRDERGALSEIITGFPSQALLAGRMKAGAVMGNHYHRRTRVFFFLQSGAAGIRTVHVATGARDAFQLAAGQGVVLEPNESHAISFTAESEWLMLKSEAYDPADPDTYRLPVPD